MFRPPANDVAEFSKLLDRDSKSRVLFLGDSIFHGRIGPSWIDDYRQANPNKHVINAGINGDLSFGVRNRLVSNLHQTLPDVVVLMVGTNDAMGSFTDGMAGGALYVVMGAPQKPTVAWHMENLEYILATLRDRGIQHRAVLTIPPLGEVRNSPANQLVGVVNKNIAKLAKSTETTLIDLNAELWKNIDLLGGAHAATKEFDGISLWKQIFGSLLHNVFGWSWDDVGEYNNKLLMSMDNIHLSNRGGAVLRELVSSFTMKL
jgi:lysophospholipase L1-like esterase